jgi:hypothetical protein
MMKKIYLDRIPERLAGNTCPKCSKRIDGGTRVNDELTPPQPKPGDFSVCMLCGALLRYNAKLRSVLVTRAERQIMQRDKRLRELIELCESVSARYRRAVQ